MFDNDTTYFYIITWLPLVIESITGNEMRIHSSRNNGIELSMYYEHHIQENTAEE